MIKYNGLTIDYMSDIQEALRADESKTKKLSDFVGMLEKNELERLMLKEENANLKMKIHGMRANNYRKPR